MNLLAWNEELDRNPPWAPTRLTVPSISEPSPDNRSTANILHEDGSVASNHFLDNATVSLDYGKQYTFSLFGKPINGEWMRIIGLNGAFFTANFNFTTGAIGFQQNLDYIETRLVGNGWYRVWYVITSNINGILPNFIHYTASADNASTFDGLNQDSLYVWRPQINEGFVPDPDFLTQEVART